VPIAGERIEHYSGVAYRDPPFCRYLIAVLGFRGERWEYPVCTRYGAHKATALAMRAHLDEHAVRSQFMTVEVEELGEGAEMPGDVGDATEYLRADTSHIV
jgi:hypothetical protein